MDVSFDAFGGANAWQSKAPMSQSAYEPVDYSAEGEHGKLFKDLEKIPLPTAIGDLLKIEPEEEKLRINGYSFNTVKVLGVVAGVYVEPDQSCVTYELMDLSRKDVKGAPTFRVIRYLGVDQADTVKDQTYNEGTCVLAVGKLRLFNNHLSLISFHIAEKDNLEEVELCQIEAKLAYAYYANDIPKRNPQQVDIPLFTTDAPLQKGAAGASQSGAGNTAMAASQLNGGRRLYQQEPTNSRGFDAHQTKIYEYIKQSCNTNSTGVSADEIRAAIRADPTKFSVDLNFLLGEGVIYNTIDDNHFAVIE